MLLFLLHILEIHKGIVDQVKEIGENPCWVGLWLNPLKELIHSGMLI